MQTKSTGCSLNRINRQARKLKRKRSLSGSTWSLSFLPIFRGSRISLRVWNLSQLMDELDEILYEFDEIVGRYHVEKIRTIGDTFMCAGGIPTKNITNPVEVVMAALELRNFLDDL